MNFVTWHNKHKKKIKDMNPGDVFIYNDCLWMLSSSEDPKVRFAIRLRDGTMEEFYKEDECEMCEGNITIEIGKLD